MKKILFSLVAIAMCIGLMGSAFAYFVDTETSTGNQFTAGLLDLTIDGQNGTNVVKFNSNGINPDNQFLKIYELKNEGNVPGYLDINLVVNSLENGVSEPELSLGDTDATGELDDVLGLTMFWSTNNSVWYETGDEYIYNAKFAGAQNNYDTSKLIPAGGTIYLVLQINWWSTANDTIAMTDQVTADFTFELAETAAQ